MERLLELANPTLGHDSQPRTNVSRSGLFDTYLSKSLNIMVLDAVMIWPCWAYPNRCKESFDCQAMMWATCNDSTTLRFRELKESWQTITPRRSDTFQSNTFAWHEAREGYRSHFVMPRRVVVILPRGFLDPVFFLAEPAFVEVHGV